MGIVSFCPKGHRTKLKDSYAGRRVYCPQCGEKFRVDTGPPAAAATGMMPEFESPFAPTTATDTATSPETPKPAAEQQTLALAASGPASTTTEPAPPSAAPADSRLPAAIAEAMDACWCIAIPGGEPGPPMSASEMAAWLTTARATGNEVVWRTGWPEWQPITATFPEFFGPSS